MSRLRSWCAGTCLVAAFLAAWGWGGRTGRADTFGAAREWAWTGPAAGDPAPAHAQVDATPIVVSLNDDNGDGRVDGADVPDIVFPTTSSLAGGCASDGVLRAIGGADGTPLFGVFAAEYRVNACSPVAAGDIDGDGLPEIVALQGTDTGPVNRLVAFENDGTFKWFSDPLPAAAWPGWGAGPSIADLDHDGRPEIVVGATVFDDEGRLVFSRPCRGNPGLFSTVANLDLVGDAEIVCGFAAYRSNGDLYWDARPAGAGPGTAAVADFDGDGLPEVAVVDGGKAWLLEHDGTPKWGPVPFEEFASANAGAPVVADLNGDGRPEIAVAGSAVYVAIDADGNVMWSAAIRDTTSATASAGFDFDGDGRTEVVHADQAHLRVFDGTTGAVLFEAPTSSCTWTENPVVADVDGDGSAEIVVPRNEACSPRFPGRGIEVFGDPAWAAAPRVWNEHAYHVTNVAADGTIPAEEPNNWQVPGLNNFRVNAFGTATQSPPVASDLSLATPEDTPASFTLPAADPDGDPLVFVVVSFPVHGTLSGFAPDLTYTPAPDYFGDDSFTFKANDGHADSNVAAVRIRVTPVNDPPTASDASFTTAEDVPVGLALVASDVDGDPLAYEIVSPPSHGSLSGTAPALTYQPAAGFSGTDAFTFRASDGQAYSNVATVTIVVTPVNHPPVAVAAVVGGSSVACAGPGGAVVTLSAVGSGDPDGDPITYAWRDDGGLLVGTTAVVDVAVPLGRHAFTLTVSDGRGGSSSASVTVVVGDSRPPRIRLSMSPPVLWPPNHKMVPVFARITVSDACDPSPKVVLKKVTSSEGDCGKPWIEGASFGTDDRTFSLRAERKGDGPGRTYTVTYTVSDRAGNKASASATVVVPHDKDGHGADDHGDGHGEDGHGAEE